MNVYVYLICLFSVTHISRSLFRPPTPLYALQLIPEVTQRLVNLLAVTLNLVAVIDKVLIRYHLSKLQVVKWRSFRLIRSVDTFIGLLERSDSAQPAILFQEPYNLRLAPIVL